MLPLYSILDYVVVLLLIEKVLSNSALFDPNTDHPEGYWKLVQCAKDILPHFLKSIGPKYIMNSHRYRTVPRLFEIIYHFAMSFFAVTLSFVPHLTCLCCTFQHQMYFIAIACCKHFICEVKIREKFHKLLINSSIA